MAQTHTPVSDLIRSVLGSASTLARAEMSLLSAEMLSKIRAVRAPAVLLGAAAAMLLLGTFVFSIAVVLLLINLGAEPYLAALGVAAVYLMAGAGLLMAGISRLGELDLMPTRTLAQLRADAAIFKGETHG